MHFMNKYLIFLLLLAGEIKKRCRLYSFICIFASLKEKQK